MWPERLIAASLPREWEVRFVDENMSPATDADFQWADAVFVTGMHVQRGTIDAVNQRAHRFGKLTVLGGPSVSACAEFVLRQLLGPLYHDDDLVRHRVVDFRCLRRV